MLLIHNRNDFITSGNTHVEIHDLKFTAYNAVDPSTKHYIIRKNYMRFGVYMKNFQYSIFDEVYSRRMVLI